jgi:hypothetical protein
MHEDKEQDRGNRFVGAALKSGTKTQWERGEDNSQQA